jgi:hypothetical protein
MIVGLLVAATAVVCVVATSAFRSERERVPGWPESLRRELGLVLPGNERCERVSLRARLRLQGRLDDRRVADGVRAIIGPAGGAWFDSCERGVLKFGLAPGNPNGLRRHVKRLRRLFRNRNVEGDVKLVAVRSSYGELARAQERLGEPYERLLSAGLASSGIDTERNAVIVEVARPVTDADRLALRGSARRAPVNVIIVPVNEDDLNVDAL